MHKLARGARTARPPNAGARKQAPNAHPLQNNSKISTSPKPGLTRRDDNGANYSNKFRTQPPASQWNPITLRLRAIRVYDARAFLLLILTLAALRPKMPALHPTPNLAQRLSLATTWTLARPIQPDCDYQFETPSGPNQRLQQVKWIINWWWSPSSKPSGEGRPARCAVQSPFWMPTAKLAQEFEQSRLLPLKPARWCANLTCFQAPKPPVESRYQRPRTRS